MLTSSATLQASGWLAAAIVAGAIGLTAAGPVEPMRPEQGAAAPAAAQPPRPAQRIPRVVLSGRVEAHSRNALEARRQLEAEVRVIARLAVAERGEVTLRESRYQRTGRADGAGMRVIQHFDIALPDAAARERLEARLPLALGAARRERAMPAGRGHQAPSRAPGLPSSG